MKLQISKWGNSLAMRILSEVARQFGLRDEDSVQAQMTADGAMTIRPAGWNRRAFAAELDSAREALPAGTSVMEELRQSARY
jgi:antitoxin MazE